MSRKNGNSAFRKSNQDQFTMIDIGGKKFQILQDKQSIKPVSKKQLSIQDCVSLLRLAGKKGIMFVKVEEKTFIPLAEFCKVDNFATAWFIYLKSRNFLRLFCFFKFLLYNIFWVINFRFREGDKMKNFALAIVFGLFLGTAFAAIQGINDAIHTEISSKLS
mgnify:CR=1 FL=1